jgi:malate synthase
MNLENISDLLSAKHRLAPTFPAGVTVAPYENFLPVNTDLFPEGLQRLLSELHDAFESGRQVLMKNRLYRQTLYDLGRVPRFEHSSVATTTDWQVAPIPKDLTDRRVEITGPISNAKMVINMLSANDDGEIACTAMLDFEDSMAPTWENVVNGIYNIRGVAHQDLSFQQVTKDGVKTYRLDRTRMAHPMVRVRGLHMVEKNITIHGTPIAAGIVDLAATAYHTARVFLASGKTPKFYVPKCEHYLEARLWNSLFQHVEEALGLQRGTLKVTFLIETLPAAFQMEEILYEIRERACGLNGGRWDKIFSDIKTLKMLPKYIMPDRSTIDMKKSWMDNYAKLLIKTCHKHGAFAMGGMSAFTPGQSEETRKLQMAKVIDDKNREATIGHDGCWVSHPYFITPAKAQFKKVNQLDVMLADFPPHPDLLPKSEGPKTLTCLRQNIRVGIAYQHGWDLGIGCISFENLMEDLATLEISRAQVWQWLHHKITLDSGEIVTPELVSEIFEEELKNILTSYHITDPVEVAAYQSAKSKIQNLFLQKELKSFFTDNN